MKVDDTICFFFLFLLQLFPRNPTFAKTTEEADICTGNTINFKDCRGRYLKDSKSEGNVSKVTSRGIKLTTIGHRFRNRVEVFLDYPVKSSWRRVKSAYLN